jgi:hypothetical protein
VGGEARTFFGWQNFYYSTGEGEQLPQLLVPLRLRACALGLRNLVVGCPKCGPGNRVYCIPSGTRTKVAHGVQVVWAKLRRRISYRTGSLYLGERIAFRIRQPKTPYSSGE